MIVDFPEIKNKINKDWNAALKAEVQKRVPMIEDSNKRIVHEGNKMGILRENGHYDVTIMESIESSVAIKFEEIPSLTFQQMMQNISVMADEIADQLGKNMLRAVDKAVEETGNTIASPNGLTTEWILEALEKIAVSFINDDRKTPVMLTVYAAPEVVSKHSEHFNALSEDEKLAFNQKYEEILDKKFQEHLIDLSSRKIID